MLLFFALPRWDIPNREVASSEPLRSRRFLQDGHSRRFGRSCEQPRPGDARAVFPGARKPAVSSSSESRSSAAPSVARYQQRRMDPAGTRRSDGLAGRIAVALRAPADHGRTASTSTNCSRFSGLRSAERIRRLRTDSGGDHLFGKRTIATGNSTSRLPRRGIVTIGSGGSFLANERCEVRDGAIVANAARQAASKIR